MRVKQRDGKITTTADEVQMKEEKALQWRWHLILQGYEDHLGKVGEWHFSNAIHQVLLRTET